MKIALCLLCVTVLLTACATGAPMKWNKPHYKQSKYEADVRACEKKHAAEMGGITLFNDPVANCLRAKGYVEMIP